MATQAHDKYYLKSLHQEIDLFDRKLAHLLKYETTATEAERTASAAKLSAKRELLARTARQLAGEGIEFNPADLPRSFRVAGDLPATEILAETISVDLQPASPVSRVADRSFPLPFAGTALDAAANMKAYKRTRTKAVVPQA